MITLIRVNDGVNGTPGAPGADGKTPYFHVKYSNDGGKTFTDNGGEAAGTYIGTCTDYNSADPTAVGSYTWAKIKGDTGPGVSAIVEQYYLSTSSTTQTGGSWSTTSPAWQSGHYIWTRSQITWTTGTITYTTPVLAQAINSANETADTALASANGKGKSYYQAAQPSGGKDGDLWFKLDSSGNATGIYKYNGSAWVEMPIESSVIASLDAAKINAGTLNGFKIIGSTLMTNWEMYDSSDGIGRFSRVRISGDNFFFDKYEDENTPPTVSTTPTQSFKFYFGNKNKGSKDYGEGLWLEEASEHGAGEVWRVPLDPYDGLDNGMSIYSDLTTNGDIIPGKISGIANLIYPVGSIYMSMNSTNPSTLFGGTWEQIKDRFLLSAGDSYSVGSTGGQSNMHIRNCGAEASGYGLTPGSLAFENRVMVTDGNYTSDTNLPPYLTVYMWKRTA